MNNKRIGWLMIAIITMMVSCAPQLDDTPPPYDDVRIADRMMYVTSSFRVYAPLVDRMRVEQLALDVYGVRSVSWSPGSYIMTVQYYPGRTNTNLIQQTIARAGYDTSDYRAVNMRPVVLPPRQVTQPRQPVTVPRTQPQPVNTQQPQKNNGGTQSHGTQSTQPKPTQNIQPQTPAQTNTQQKPQNW